MHWRSAQRQKYFIVFQKTWEAQIRTNDGMAASHDTEPSDNQPIAAV
jgi:hypothetical protein